MAAKNLLLVLAFLCTLYSALGDDACPFDSTCKCQPSYTETRDFASIACSSSALPDLSGKTNVTYSVGTVAITSESIHELPAGYFSSFSDITDLVLINNGSNIVDQQFDPAAFESVQISQLWFSGISKLIPVPDSIKVQSLLQGLAIYRHGQANVGASAFQDFVNLTSLAIHDAPLTIDDYALSGLEHRLENLVLSGLGLQAFPGAALSNLRWLRNLDLSANKISTIPKGILTAYPRLINLDLSGNPLSQDIMHGNLNSLPTLLTTLYLINVGLKSVPNDLLQENLQLKSIALSGNQIDRVRINDFVSVPDLEYLSLENNPISTIERGSFQRLSKVSTVVLSNTSLASIDFSLFAGTILADSVVVFLDSNAWLTSIDFHPGGLMPTTLRIKLTNSGLETINSGIKSLLDLSPLVSIDISGNSNVNCTGLDWLAPYVLCSEQIMTDNYTLCSDQKDMRMDTYMQSIFKGHCPSVAPPTSGVSTTAAGGSSTGNPSTTTTPSGSTQISASVITFLIAVTLAIFKTS